MKSKLAFRILGALSSALIIVSVFVPFVNVAGNTISLWETFKVIDSLYLPIMIIVFGAIGVIFFSLNIKTEFAYMSTGAISFFVIMRTIDILQQGAFSDLSIGYYFLTVGAFLTGIMAFLTNLKSNKKKEESIPVIQSTQPSMLDQIDKLYNDQTTIENEITPIQPINNIVEPIPIQPIETTIQQSNEIEIQPMQQEVVSQPIENVVISENSIPVEQPVQIEQPIQPVETTNVEQPVNPVVQGFVNQQPVQQSVQIEQPIQSVETTNVEQPVNPVVQGFVNQQPVNPVVQEFMNPGSSVLSTQNTGAQEVDIFGQSINK